MSRNIGGYLVELLAANDIDTVFGIPGVHNLELYRGLTSSSIRHVLVRHEQGAGFAADGYARLSGRPAAAFVISGPGLTNIMTAVAQAYSDSVPLLVVAAAPARASFTKQWGVLHELFDQAAVAAGVFGMARSARSAEDVRDHLRLCLASFRAGRPRPAYLEIPLDLLAEPTSLEAHRFGTPRPAAAGGRRTNRGGRSFARRCGPAPHRGRRRRTGSFRGAAPPGRNPGLSAADHRRGQGSAAGESSREFRRRPGLPRRPRAGRGRGCGAGGGHRTGRDRYLCRPQAAARRTAHPHRHRPGEACRSLCRGRRPVVGCARRVAGHQPGIDRRPAGASRQDRLANPHRGRGEIPRRSGRRFRFEGAGAMAGAARRQGRAALGTAWSSAT